MATIRVRNGKRGTSYEVQIRMSGQPRITATFDRLTDARRWASKTESEMRYTAKFKVPEARRRTLTEAIDRYLETRLPLLAPRTVPSYRRHLAWWSEQIGYLVLDDVTAAVLVMARDEIAKTFSPATANRYMNTLSSVLTAAVREWQWLDGSPARLIPRLRESSGRTRYLNEDELVRFLAACREDPSPYLLPTVIIALTTGMRRAEILKLRWRDVNLADRLIVLEVTKNKDRRLVPLTAGVEEQFRRLMEASNVVDLEGRVFPPQPRNSDGLLDLRIPFDRAKAAAGLSDFRFHDLRHTAGSYLAMMGVPTRTIAEVLGHRTLQMALRYSHLSKDHLRGVVDSLDRKIESSKETS